MVQPVFAKKPVNGLENALRNQPVAPQSETVRAGVKHIAQNTNNFANHFISANDNQTSSRTVVHHHYGYSYIPSWWYFYPQPMVVVDGGGRGSNDDGAARLLIALFAAAVGGIALYAVGAAIGRLQASRQDLSDARSAQNLLERYSRVASDNDKQYVEEAKHATSLKVKICKRIRNSAITDLALRIIMGVGCGMLLAGALATSPGCLLLAGSVAIATSGGAMLFKWGLESTDRQNGRDAESIRASVQLLNAL